MCKFCQSKFAHTPQLYYLCQLLMISQPTVLFLICISFMRRLRCPPLYRKCMCSFIIMHPILCYAICLFWLSLLSNACILSICLLQSMLANLRILARVAFALTPSHFLPFCILKLFYLNYSLFIIYY